MSKAEEVTSQVRQLVLAGRKIEAVKLFRDNTWSSLLDAKLAVEALAEGRSLEKDIDWLDELYRAIEQGDFQASVDLLSRHTPLDRLTAEKQIRQLFGQYAAESVAPVNDPELNQKIEVLIRAGKKIEAVKLYKDQTKLGLAESKLAVEQIEQVLIRNATDVSDEKRNSMLGEASSPSSNLHRFARTLAFLYALICLVAIAFIIGLSLGQPVSVNPCKVSQDLPADAQLVELLKWKNANIPSTTGNFFLEDRFLDYRIEPGLPAKNKIQNEPWDQKLTGLTLGAARTVESFWRCTKLFSILFASGVLFAIWACFRPGFWNSLALLVIGILGYPKVAELLLGFHCDYAARWFVPLIIPAAFMFVLVFVGFGRRDGLSAKVPSY